MAGLDGISTLAQVLGSLAPNGNSSIKGVTSVAETSVSSLVKSGTSSSETVVTTDTASFGSTSGVVAAALTTPEVRLDKVAALQTSIANGSYGVSSAEVAGKIVDSLLK
jgi:negative regulator of flagellin synthesis FlgM